MLLAAVARCIEPQAIFMIQIFGAKAALRAAGSRTPIISSSGSRFKPISPSAALIPSVIAAVPRQTLPVFASLSPQVERAFGRASLLRAHIVRPFA